MLIFISILGIGLLILIHELGHFVTAKAFGMRAEKFYIGFPPAAVKRQIGETEYGIGFVPLGGYVKISGMTREEELPDEVVPRAYYSKPVWQRVIVISAGALMNVLLAFALFFIFYWQEVPNYQVTNVVAQVQSGSGAQKAGIKPGDKVLAVDGAGSGDVNALRSKLETLANQRVTVVIQRDGKTINLPATVGTDSQTGKGLLGVLFQPVQVGTMDITAFQALKMSLGEIKFVTTQIFIFLKNLFISSQSRQEVTSPIGIVAISSETIQQGWGIYISVLGFISLQLAIINLLPLLPLDGGHVLVNILEKIKGGPIRREILERVSFIGLVLFGMLFVMGVFNDIQRLTGPGFGIQP